MSGEYSRVSTNDEDEGVAASPASANGKPLLKKDKGEKKPFSDQAKEDFWSNVSFVCCGGYKRERPVFQPPPPPNPMGIGAVGAKRSRFGRVGQV